MNLECNFVCFIWGSVILEVLTNFLIGRNGALCSKHTLKLSYDDGTLHQLEPPLPLASFFNAHHTK